LREVPGRSESTPDREPGSAVAASGLQARRVARRCADESEITMRGAVRIGKLFGIDVALDYSWVFVFLLMSANLTVLFESWHPTWSMGASAFLAVVAALLFFASVLLHEMAHALVARAFGMTVREIRLFLFGGVSNIEREPSSPKAEFWMAIVGPLTSFAIGALLVFVAGATLTDIDAEKPWESLSRLSPLSTLLLWLGPLNVIVGLFNLTPGFPLDGGRVLRAAIWWFTGDLHVATFAASTIGRVIGWCFVASGIAMAFGAHLPVFGQGAASGIWLAFIGWFLSSAADRSFGSLLVEEALDGVVVSELMGPAQAGVPQETTVRMLVDGWFSRAGDTCLPVVANGDFVGLVSLGDLRKYPRETWQAVTVGQLMTPAARLPSLAPSDIASRALRMLADAGTDSLPVRLDGRVVGMLSRTAVARWLELHIGQGTRPVAVREA
jgi:Zn-dependent protease/CBS domain-containing protein